MALSALLLAGGIAIGWWRPWQGGAAPPRPVPPAPEPQVAAAPAREPEATAPPVAPTRAEALRELRPLLPEGASVVAPVPAKPSPAAAAPAPPEPAPAAPAPVVVPTAPAPAAQAPAPPRSEGHPAAHATPKQEERKPAAKPAPPKELPSPPDRVLAASELPAALREALPPLAIRGYVHSDDAASRLVVVNDRMLREGDDIAPDLKLERIDPEGMVLNFRGYRFIAPR
jgi:general secretion pathway protein B